MGGTYNGSPMIDTPKIDTFFQISRNFRKTRKYLFKKIQNIYRGAVDTNMTETP